MKSLLLAGIASLIPFSAWAACQAPSSPPSPPNGATATREQMVSAQAAIKDYNVAVNTYAECARKSGVTDVEVGRVIGQLEKVAQQFNAELRAFKQKSGAQ
jgi:hypothetical protein